MGKLTSIINVSLDGVIQAPGRPDEDIRGGFVHGGWAVPYAAMQHAGESIGTAGALLFGRWTFESFDASWSKADSPFTGFLNAIPKYVASRTLRAPLHWQNSSLLQGDVGKAVATLKQSLAKDLVMMGSPTLLRTLLADAQVDQLILLIHPLTVGSGQRLFGDDSQLRNYALKNVRSTPTGVVAATYQQSGT